VTRRLRQPGELSFCPDHSPVDKPPCARRVRVVQAPDVLARGLFWDTVDEMCRDLDVSGCTPATADTRRRARRHGGNAAPHMVLLTPGSISGREPSSNRLYVLSAARWWVSPADRERGYGEEASCAFSIPLHADQRDVAVRLSVARIGRTQPSRSGSRGCLLPHGPDLFRSLRRS
jgi:hypothetical protein